MYKMTEVFAGHEELQPPDKLLYDYDFPSNNEVFYFQVTADLLICDNKGIVSRNLFTNILK